MKAIKSVLANRKLFQGGGLVPPGNPGPANGILASSESLIDAVVRDTVNPQGGPTLSMDQGGVARFQRGGDIRQRIAEDLLRLQQAVLQGDTQGAQQIEVEITQKWGDKVDQHFPNRDLTSILAAAAGTQPERLTSPTSAIPLPPPPPPGSVNVQEEPAALQRRLPITMSPDAPTQPVPLSPFSPTRISDDPFVAPPEPEIQVEPVISDPGMVQEPTELYGWGTSALQPLQPIDVHQTRRSILHDQPPVTVADPTTMERIDTRVPSQTPDLSTALPTRGLWSDAAYDVLTKPTDARLILEQQRNPGADLVNRLFPAALQPGQLEQELNIAQIAAHTAAGEPPSRATEYVSRAGAGLTEIFYKIGGNLAQDIMAGLDLAFDPATRDQSFTQVRGMAELIQRGQPEWKNDIINFGRIAVEKGLTGDAFKADIAREISLKYEDTAPFTGGRTAAETTDLFAAEVPPPEPGIGETLFRDASTAVGEMIYGSREELAAKQAAADEQIKVLRAEAYKKALAGVEEEVTPPVAEAEAEVAEAEVAEVKTPPTSDKDPATNVVRNETGQGSGQGEDKTPGVDVAAAPDEVLAAFFAAQQKDAALIAKFAYGDDEEATKAKIQNYMEEFVFATPDYEGKSEWEQGMDIVKMGMAIAAGESPNAITNIAKGVLATIDNFTDDDKERREYKRQVNLAAANYAMGNITKDRALLADFAKEQREFKYFAVKTPFTDPITGKEYDTGSMYQTTVGDIQNGLFDVLPGGVLTTETLMGDILDNMAINAKYSNGMLMIDSGRGTPTGTSLEESLIKYNGFVDNAETSIKMQAMIDSNMIINAKDGRVTGVTAWANEKLNFLKNTLEFKEAIALSDSLALSSEYGQESTQFDHQQRVIANMMLKELLGEGSKNVSNIDRTLADEIVGLMKDWGKVGADPDIIQLKLNHIRSMISKGLREDMKNMSVIEFRWQKIANRAGIPVKTQLQASRQDITEFFGRAPGLPGLTQPSPAGPLSVWDYFDKETGAVIQKIPTGQG